MSEELFWSVYDEKWESYWQKDESRWGPIVLFILKKRLCTQEEVQIKET